MQFYIKNFSPFRDRVLGFFFSAPSTQKAHVLLSYKKFSSRFARKEEEGGDRSKFCNFSFCAAASPVGGSGGAIDWRLRRWPREKN